MQQLRTLTKAPAGIPPNYPTPSQSESFTGRQDSHGILAIADLQSTFSLPFQFDVKPTTGYAHLANVEQIGQDQPKGLSWQAA